MITLVEAPISSSIDRICGMFDRHFAGDSSLVSGLATGDIRHITTPQEIARMWRLKKAGNTNDQVAEIMQVSKYSVRRYTVRHRHHEVPHDYK